MSYKKDIYFDMPSSMLLSDRGEDRLATLTSLAGTNNTSQKDLNKSIRKAFDLTPKGFKFFSLVNNCKKYKRK